MTICVLTFCLADWGAAGHESERKLFIERLQKLAKHRSIRVSFIAGDVSDFVGVSGNISSNGICWVTD